MVSQAPWYTQLLVSFAINLSKKMALICLHDVSFQHEAMNIIFYLMYARTMHFGLLLFQRPEYLLEEEKLQEQLYYWRNSLLLVSIPVYAHKY